MRLITAVIRPEKLNDVMSAVTDAGARGLTATRASGFGQQYGHVRKTGEASRAVLLPKARVDIVVRDEDADAVMNALVKCVNTGTIGDGKVWSTSVDSVVRARTGERDHDAV
ncbi:MAG TPA: P-II family nitrogen regulator [Streptosporangiaceae bacterium]|nr:P-II family nitrogen regulator [Streptosporangiaceae bacterium]